MTDLSEAFARLHIADRKKIGVGLMPTEVKALAAYLDEVMAVAADAADTLGICARSASSPGWEKSCRAKQHALQSLIETDE